MPSSRIPSGRSSEDARDWRERGRGTGIGERSSTGDGTGRIGDVEVHRWEVVVVEVL